MEQLRLHRADQRGCKPALPLAWLLRGLLFHVLFSAGTLAEHVRQLSGWQKAESTLADRRAALGWPAFPELLRQALRPLARPKRNPEAFWHGLRLVAWDGTQFSLTNTAQVLAQLPKAADRRKTAAWARMTAVVLLEVGLHNPLAAAVGWQGQSEYVLTRSLIPALPPHSLLLADRLSGVSDHPRSPPPMTVLPKGIAASPDVPASALGPRIISSLNAGCRVECETSGPGRWRAKERRHLRQGSGGRSRQEPRPPGFLYSDNKLGT